MPFSRPSTDTFWAEADWRPLKIVFILINADNIPELFLKIVVNGVKNIKFVKWLLDYRFLFKVLSRYLILFWYEGPHCQWTIIVHHFRFEIIFDWAFRNVKSKNNRKCVCITDPENRVGTEYWNVQNYTNTSKTL